MSKWIGTVVMAAGGVLLLWVGMSVLFGESRPAALPADALGLVCALALLVAGEWLCWRAVARHTRPPVQAERIAGIVGAVMMSALLLAACILSVRVYGIS